MNNGKRPYENLQGSLVDSQAGASLAEILVGMSIMLITALAFTTMMTNQMREVRGVSEKLAAVELKGRLELMLSKASVCDGLVANTAVNADAPYHLDLVTLSNNNFSLNDLRATASAATKYVEVGQTASAISNSFVVQSIELRNFVNIGTNLFSADIVVTPVQSALVRPMRSVVQPITVATTAAGVTTSCSAPTATGPAIEVINLPANTTPYTRNHNGVVEVIFNLGILEPGNALLGFVFAVDGTPVMQVNPPVNVNYVVSFTPYYVHRFTATGNFTVQTNYVGSAVLWNTITIKKY